MFSIGIFLFFLTATTCDDSFDLTILHTNDVHARFYQFNSMGGRCTAEDLANSTCYGGAARRLSAVKMLRKQYPNVVVLDAGDQFQGTLWYSLLKWEPIAHVMNSIGYDGMAFGNHEFDDGLVGLTPFVKNLTFPVVNSNIQPSGTDFDQIYKRSHIIQFENGQKVGIVGYTTTETPSLANTVPLKFEDEISALQNEVQRLKNQGITAIVAIGHSGISIDRKICQSVPDIDVVIGGHTNTFLYTGKQPSSEKPEGPYPEVYRNKWGKCLVVTDYAFGKYLGFLKVTFDKHGNVEKYSGNPILLDNNSYTEDQSLLKQLEKYESKLKSFEQKVLAYSSVAIDGHRLSCRLRECNLGNIITDAAVYHIAAKHPLNNSFTGWTTAAIGIMNGGGVRDFQTKPHSNITMADLYTIMPFGNTFDIVTIAGQHLKETLEYSVENYSYRESHGKFLQVSGLKVTYDMNKPNGKRVAKVMVRCAECSLPNYEELKKEKIYSLVVPAYIAQGGDGFRVLQNNIISTINTESLDVDVVTEYLEKFQPVTTGLEGRIQFIGDPSVCSSALNVPPQSIWFCFILLLCLMLI